jgi:peptide/nickel transport system ATP-binding protein
MSPRLRVEDLAIEYRQARGKRFRAVDGVSFELRAGETLALVGESGSGKSTIAKALCRIERPAAGKILLDGREVSGRHGLGEYRRRVQMVFQDPFASLNPAHSIGHHLARPLKLHHHLGRSEAESEVVRLLESVNLRPAADVARRYPHELSGGQRQRVAISRALAPGPDVMLADEPVSMLDVSIRLDILALLDGLKQERQLALLYITHDLATARHFSAEIMVMYRGRIVERGPADDVILRPAHPYTRLLASAAPAPRKNAGQAQAARAARLAARARQSAERRELTLASGCGFKNRCPHAMSVCDQEPPELPAAEDGHAARCWLLSEMSAGASGHAGSQSAPSSGGRRAKERRS